MSKEKSVAPEVHRENYHEELWKIRYCQFEDLKFADAKAMALLTASAAIAAFNKNLQMDGSTPLGQWILFSGYVATGGAVLWAISAIMPLGLHEKGPLTHFTGITGCHDPAEYIKRIESCETKLDDELSRDIYRMASRAKLKYLSIRRAVVFFGLELVCFLACFLIPLVVKTHGAK